MSAASTASAKLEASKANPIATFAQARANGMLAFGNETRSSRRIADYSKKGEIKNVPTYGTVTGDDGSTWIYTMTTTESPTHPFSYGSATINMYDGSNTLVTTVTVNVPDSMNVNDIEPFGAVSTKFYDTNSRTKEFVVYMHEVGPNYTSIGHFVVYNTNGEIVKQYDDLGNIIWFDATEKYDTYQRAIFVEAGTDELGNATTKMSIMKPASWNANEPVAEHVFEVREDLVEYSNGPCLNTYKVDGKPYYMLSHYEKPFIEGYDENYEAIITQDNNYVVEVYDKDYNVVSSFKVPVTHAEDVYCSEYTCGLYSYNDLLKGYYTGDSKLNIVVTRMDVRLDTSDDTYPYAFLVYDQDGNLVNTIAENVINWKQLTAINGESDQVGCIVLNSGVESLEMINVPSCEKAITFEAETAGRKISGNYDRYPAEDGFQYVIGMGDATSDAENNVIASIGWFKQDGTLDNYVDFNLGENGEYFTPLIEGYCLDPSLINTDEVHEYVYIAKKRRADTGNIENVLVIANADGEDVKTYSGGTTKSLAVAAIIDTEVGKPRLVVGFKNNTSGTYDLDFYDLPFVKFEAGGDGSEANPYVITSPGDMKHMADAPNAHYILGNDIDMSQIADSWTPVKQFAGTFNGQGYTISNFYLNSNESYAGICSYLNADGSFKNVKFKNPTIVTNAGNNYVGLIAGMTTKSVIDSVFVEGLKATGNGNNSFGGIAGIATYYTAITSCYFKNANVNIPNGSNVAGIAGETRTATTIDACAVTGKITAKNTVGGIVGSTRKNSTVNNCHVNAAIKGENTVGGIAGCAGRFPINNNIVEGSVEATTLDMYGNACAGGVAGQLESDWEKAGGIVMQDNVVALKSITAPEGANAVHRIAGFTIGDEQYEEGETRRTETGLQDNYCVATLAANGDKGATLVDGADAETINKEFLQSLGFNYGTTSAAPWDGEALPKLYFEDNEDALVGDVNGDGVVDVTDINALLNVILGIEDASKYDGRADVTGNGDIDVSDVNAVINIVLGK